MTWARKEEADLVVFPAGFLSAQGNGKADAIEAAGGLLDCARRERLAVVVGVDLSKEGGPGKQPHKRRQLDGSGRLPYFAVVWSPELPVPHAWQQRSINHADWRNVSAEWNQEVRSFHVGEALIGLALCGEAFSPPIRTGLLNAGPALVVVPAHTAAGSRHSRALSWFGEQGLPALRAVHAIGAANNVLWSRNGKNPPMLSERFSPHHDHWASAGLFEVP